LKKKNQVSHLIKFIFIEEIGNSKCNHALEIQELQEKLDTSILEASSPEQKKKINKQFQLKDLEIEGS